MEVTICNITSKKVKKNKSGLERFDHALDNFKYKKAGSCNISELLQSKKIALYCLDFKREVAVFIEVEDPKQLGKAAFFSDYQFENAVKLYLVPISLFNESASNIANLATDFILVGFTARSGSTLLCKAIAEAENIFGVTEPFSLINIGNKYEMASEDGTKLIRSSLIFYSNFAKNNGASTVLLKPHPTALDVFEKIFPDKFKRYLFITREAEPVVKSLVQRLPLVQRVLLTMVIENEFKKKLLEILPIEAQTYFSKNYGLKAVSIYKVVSFIWWVYPMAEMRKILQNNAKKCLNFTYKEFTTDPETSMKKIYNFCGISQQYLPASLAEFNKDSQRDTVLSLSKKIKLFDFEYTRIERDVKGFVDLGQDLAA